MGQNVLLPRVIPCLLLQDGRLVKTVKFKDPQYIGDPINAIRIYNEKEVDELFLLDIGATPGHRQIQFTRIREIAGECFMPLAYGGGIKSLDDIHTLFELGIEKVVINSHSLEHPEFIRAAADKFGSQSVVASIDVRKKMFGGYEVCSQGGRKPTKLDPISWARQVQTQGAGEVLLASIDRDGTWQGYDLQLIRSVAEAVDIPVVACGGAGRIEDFSKAINEAHCSAVAAGSMFVYQGNGLGVLIKFPSRNELKKALTKP